MAQSKLISGSLSDPTYKKGELLWDRYSNRVILLFKTASNRCRFIMGVVVYVKNSTNGVKEVGHMVKEQKCNFPYLFNGKIELSNDEENNP